VLELDVPAPPEPKTEGNGASATDSITLTIKVTKPAKSFTLPALAPTDTVADLKAALAKQPGAPPPDSQRLLLRGKALADGKLLKEYAVKDGDVVNLMLKAGVEWDWSAPPPPTISTSSKAPYADEDGDAFMKPPPTPPGSVPLVSPSMSRTSSKGGRMHTRIPSVVLSPSPSVAPSSADLLSPSSPIRASLNLNLDTAQFPSGAAAANVAAKDEFRGKIARPDAWVRLYSFLRGEFGENEDAAKAFELFLLGSKGELTPSEIAMIRDTVGLTGMAGAL